MPQKITNNEAAEYGININHEQMENGELRFRLTSNDGSSYVRVVSPNISVWQNSHYHTTLTETYIVQKGYIIFAQLQNGKAIFERIKSGEIYSSKAYIPHNVYLSADCIFHCVKHGNLSKNDWLASPDLDRLTKHLTENEVLLKLKLKR